jgi:hypothetical protein
MTKKTIQAEAKISLVEGMTQAIEQGDDARLAKILDKKGDPNARDQDHQWTMAMWACRGFPRQPKEAWMERALQGRARCLALLLSAGADVVAPKNPSGWGCAHWAARDGSLECLSMLIEQGVDIQAKNHHGNTPLQLACNQGRADFAKFIIDKIGPQLVPQEEWAQALQLAAGNQSVEAGAAVAMAYARLGHDAEDLILATPSGYVGIEQWREGVCAALLAMREQCALEESLGDPAEAQTKARPNRARV